MNGYCIRLAPLKKPYQGRYRDTVQAGGVSRLLTPPAPANTQNVLSKQTA